MINNIKISLSKQIMIVYIVLIVTTLAVFWHANQFDFINFDDGGYVTANRHIQSGISQNGIRWAFSTRYLDLWHPLTWLSFMFDYQLHGLNPGGYHLTNLILHILITLLLFWLFNRMTGAVWKSAFIAALFALHPLHVESVAWIAERKDVLSAFFWMLTLCLYVYYTEKPAIRRYLLVVFSFVCALMSKPMVVTLPVIMILLDYWPLNRFELKKGNLVLWQLKEKIVFFILSAVLIIITLHNPANTDNPDYKDLKEFSLRLADAPVAFVTYLAETFWPHNLAVFYPFPDQIPLWQVFGSSLLIIFITGGVILTAKRMPYLLVGWFWYAIILLPVIGIIQVSSSAPYSMADRYTYLSSIGITVAIAWGIPSFVKSEKSIRKILFPAAIVFLLVISFTTWKQCSYWKNSFNLFNHALRVTKNNYLAYGCLGYAYSQTDQYPQAIDHFDKAVRLKPNALGVYNGLGIAYGKSGQYQQAIENFNKAISIKKDYAKPYNGLGLVYSTNSQYKLAIENFNKAIGFDSEYADAYNNRAVTYLQMGDAASCCRDALKACALGNCKILDAINKDHQNCPKR